MRGTRAIALVLLFVVAGLFSRPCRAQEEERLATLKKAYAHLEAGENEAARGLFQGLLEKSPDDARLHYDIAFTFVGEGNLFWAQRHLMQALELDDSCALCHRLLAIVLARTGDWETAAQQMTRYRELGGRDLSGWAALIDGVVAYKGQQFDVALDHLDTIGSRAPGDIRQAGTLYTDAITRMKGVSYAPFEGYVGASLLYDSNVRLDPGDDPLLGSVAWYDPFSRDRAAAFGTSLSAGITGRPIRGAFVLEGWGRAYKSIYFTERAGGFDLTQGAVGIRGRLPGLAELAFGYDATVTMLGRGEDFWGPMWSGDAAVSNPDFYVFQEAHAIHVSARFKPHEDVTLSPRYAAAWRFHELSRQDVIQNLVDLNASYFLLDGRLRLYATPVLFVNLTMAPTGGLRTLADADEKPLMDAYDAWGMGLALRASGALHNSVSITGGATVNHTDYFHSKGDFAGVNEDRKDTTLTVNLGLSWLPVSGLSVGTGYRFFRSFSTISDYDYPRHTFDIANASWRF